MLSDGSSTFLDGAGLDEHLQADSSTGSQAYLTDHLGSTSRLLDSLNGSNKALYDYTSYGKLEGDLSNPSASNPYTYTGREDDSTGLYYYRARYYDPELEVFDPLGDAQRYVGGNPIGLVDPLGLKGSLQINIATMWKSQGQPGTFDSEMEFANNFYSKAAAGVDLQTTPDIRAFSPVSVSNSISIYQPTDVLIIRGHGNPTSIGGYLGTFNNQSMQAVLTSENIANALKPILTKQVAAPKKIVINACQTGLSLAQHLSQLLYNSGVEGVEVVAPTTNQFLPLSYSPTWAKYVNGKNVENHFLF